MPESAAGAITRRHLLHDHAADGAAGLYSVIGGKLTTYRELADQVVERAQRDLGVAEAPSLTKHQPLPGARQTEDDYQAFRQRFLAESGLPERSARHLVDVYGARANEILARASTPELRRPFDPASGAIGAEVPFAFEREEARTLADVLLRRTMVGLGPDLGLAALDRAAALAAAHCGWDDARRRREIAAYHDAIARFQVAPSADPAPVPA